LPARELGHRLDGKDVHSGRVMLSSSGLPTQKRYGTKGVFFKNLEIRFVGAAVAAVVAASAPIFQCDQ